MDVACIVRSTTEALESSGDASKRIELIAGPELPAHCRLREPEGCRTGHSVLTPGFKLHSKFIVHSVPPKWSARFEVTEDSIALVCFNHNVICPYSYDADG